MAKRRTRKQKEKAANNFTISWDDTSVSASSRTTVKGEKSKSNLKKKQTNSKAKKSMYSEELVDLKRIKFDIMKSVFVASGIFVLELVIYWIWR